MILHSDALATLRAWAAPDAEQERLRRRFVAHLETHADGLERACLPDHITASALVLSEDGERVLLTLHGKARAWFQFGGHCEPGDQTLAGAALREAAEESGVAGLDLDLVPVQLSEHAVPFCGPGDDTRHLDVRFVAVAPATASLTVSEESLDVRWWPVSGLPSPDPDVVELVRLARDRVDPAAQSVGSGVRAWVAADHPNR